MKFKNDPEQARALWARALEKAEAESTPKAYGIIRDGDAFDPLGIACQAYMEAEGYGHWVPIGWYFNSNADIKSNFLPAAVQKWLGLSDEHCRFQDGTTMTARWDRQQMSWAEAADLVEMVQLAEVE